MTYDSLSKYRGELFGIATVLVVIFHYVSDLLNQCEDALPSVIRIGLKGYSNVFRGVEIFLILMAMGLFFSMRKNSDIGQFYKRRLSRIFIPYLIVGGIFYIILDLMMRNETIWDVLSDFFFITFVTTKGGDKIWYVGFTVFLYLLFPLLFNYSYDPRKDSIKPNRVLMVIAVYVVLTVALCFAAPTFIVNTEIATGRILLSLVAYLMVPEIQRSEKIRIAHLILCAVLTLLFVGLRLLGERFGLAAFCDIVKRWYRSGIGFFVSLAFCWLIPKLPERINACLRWIGTYSLEIYLLHVTLRALAKELSIPTYNPLVYAIIIAVSVPLSVALSKLNGRIAAGKPRAEAEAH